MPDSSPHGSTGVQPSAEVIVPFVDHARTAHAAAETTYGELCRWCGHRHDPEDGRCDVHAHVGLGVCPCPGEGLVVAYDKVNAALYVAEQDCAELRGQLESIHAAGVAEGRAAMRDEIVVWAQQNGYRATRNAIEAAFPTEPSP